jgi:hypothetical protein
MAAASSTGLISVDPSVEKRLPWAWERDAT